MKKYFLFALALVILAAAPAFGQATVSGALRYAGIWELGEDNYVGSGAFGAERVRFNVWAQIDDYNYARVRFDQANVGTDTSDLWGTRISHAFFRTDLGKFFELDEMGFGLTNTIGVNSEFGPGDVLGFTIYDIGSPDDIEITGKTALRLDADVMGIVTPYYVTQLEAYGDAGFIVGAGVDFAPVVAQLYFGQDGGEFAREFGLNALFSDEVADGIVLDVGFGLVMENSTEDWRWAYTFGTGVGAYGAQVDLALEGMEDYALANVAASVKYDILPFLGVQSGMKLALGDAADDFYNEENFLGAEFGAYLKPGKSTWGFGYIIANEDAGVYSPHDGPLSSTAFGGLYLTASTSF